MDAIAYQPIRQNHVVYAEDDYDEDSHHPKKMRLRHVLRIAGWHLALYCFVICYILIGAFIFHYLEGEYENKRHVEHKRVIKLLKSELFEKISSSSNETHIQECLRHFMENISRMHISVENYLMFDDDNNVPKRWTYPSSVLFAFTILTTIGYGNVAPTTRLCQIFTMVYGALGIPLFLITIADVGRFFKTGIMYIIQAIYKKELKKQGERKLFREIGEVMLVAMLFLAFIAAGSAVLPLWEHQLTYFDSVYFSYMSLTTIGLGDIVPRRMDFLLPTLIYITIGLWLTTALVEQLADVFRLVHYAGRHVSNVKGITVWLGGRRLSVGSLIQTVCRRVGMSDHIISQINWDKTLDQALNGEQPPLVPIFPWHFADFIEHDPPLIDLSLDFDQMDSPYYFTAPTICNSPNHNTLRRKLSAPPFEKQNGVPNYRNFKDIEDDPSIETKDD
uniref:Potassium channel domain-containing protein n=1 Tax=Panagrolaimus sp. JU765 TaxID=591449 RepID=A0AC34RJ94_9BILA